jgi:curved DNA-binding protein
MDYYKILGVSREASADDIRKAYRKLARENHPDRKPGDKQAAETFKQVQQAYDVLGDQEKREQFDRYGAAFENMGRGGAQAGGGRYGSSGGSGPVDLESIFGQGGFGGAGFDFSDLFGGGGAAGGSGRRGRGQSRATPGQNLQTEMTVPFNLAALGGTYEISLDKGAGVERLDVKIPAGLKDGATIRLAKQGYASQTGGPAGDLLVTVKIASHPYFKREGNNLLVDIPVTIGEAVLGGKIEVPTLDDGIVVLTLPAGTSSGARLRLKGKGLFDKPGGTRGDQFAVVKIVVPKQTDDAAKDLIRQFDQSAPLMPRAGMWS